MGEPGRLWSNWKGRWADRSSGFRVCSGYRLIHGIEVMWGLFEALDTTMKCQRSNNIGEQRGGSKAVKLT